MAESSLVRLQAYVEEHQAELYRLAYSYMKNRDDALDAVQESIVRAIDKLHTLRDEERLRVWLTRIVVNECLSRLRRRRPSVPLEDWDGPKSSATMTSFGICAAPLTRWTRSCAPSSFSGSLRTESSKRSLKSPVRR